MLVKISIQKVLRLSVAALFGLLICLSVGQRCARADFTIELDINDFGVTSVFNTVNTFNISIDVVGPLQTGVYSNPTLAGVNYNVRGTLADSTPSGFPAFNLVRAIGGDEFYSQGSSLNFEVAANTDFTDGLQVSELVTNAGAGRDGADLLFEFNAREVGTGRYHPPLFQLHSGGGGIMLNSNNFGGDNPQDGTTDEIDVDFGEEYIVDLDFSPSLTIATSAVPEPSSVLSLFALAMLGFCCRVRS